MIFKAMFKCRLCGKTFGNTYTGDENLAFFILLDLIHEGKSSQPNAPKIFDYHNCDDNSYGFADFLGWKAT